MSLLTRVGLAVVRPRMALAIAGDRERAGRSGTDLLVALIALIVVTRARALVTGVWLGAVAEPVLGFRAVAQTLTDALAIVLGFLVLGAAVIWAGAGPRRELGRASDLACVAVLPLIVVELVATVVLLAAGIEAPRGAMIALSLVGYVWTGALIALAVIQARRASATAAPPTLARGAGWGVAGIAFVGLALQVMWIVPYFDRMRPASAGGIAPDFTLPRIEAKGALGAPFQLASTRGKIVVIDFWATWCQPCVKSLPRLQAAQRQHPDIAIVTINIDEPADARELFDEAGYTLTLLAGAQEVLDRYGVAPIPHTVVIDPNGVVRRVHRGSGLDLEREISALR